jgi:hypothetical protein
LLQGIADVEGWATDTSSTLLVRNHGNPGALYRLHLWSAIEPRRGLFVFAQGEAEAGNARAITTPGVTAELEQAGLRYARHRSAVLNLGRMYHPLGAFAPRIFSTRNPLIGIPDGYTPVYPWGAMINGERKRVDYRVAAVSRPLTHRDYVPPASDALRPVVGIGVSPWIGFRIGASATSGPYLNRDLSSSQLNGQSWRSYHQRVIAGEAQYGVGHFDLRAEYAHADFDVPRNGRINGQTGYVETRYTVTPQLFLAARGEVNQYPFIASFTPTTWVSRQTSFRDVEAGLGFRVTESTLVKATFRVDNWDVTSDNSAFVRPGGRAFGVQVSQAFDVMRMMARSY